MQHPLAAPRIDKATASVLENSDGDIALAYKGTSSSQNFFTSEVLDHFAESSLSALSYVTLCRHRLTDVP